MVEKASFDQRVSVIDQKPQEFLHLSPDDYDPLCGDDGEASEESPTALPSNKFKYVMAVNNSKLARKPYYKQLQKNKFEREFCLLMDPRIMVGQKIAVLYQVFAQVQINATNTEKRDGREILTYLKLELDSKEVILEPLKHELLYFLDLVSAASGGIPAINSSAGGNVQNKKNGNFSLERGPLPMIQELNIENSQIVSPMKPGLKFDSANKSITITKKSSSKALPVVGTLFANVATGGGRNHAVSSYQEEEKTMKLNGSQKSLREAS